MRTPPPLSLRRGRCNNEHVLMLVVLLVLAAVAAIRLSTPEQPPGPRPLWDRVVRSLVGLLQCFGLVIIASVLVASVEVLKQVHSRYKLRQVEKKLTHPQQLSRDGRAAGLEVSEGIQPASNVTGTRARPHERGE
jgi:hypothetical protein